jgi:hypothetical protein
MKSIVAYPFEFNNLLFPQKTPAKTCGKLVAHYELFKKVKHVDGAIVKCGITAKEGFFRFTLLKDIISSPYNQKMIAFQRCDSFFEEEVDSKGEVTLKVKTHEDRTTGNVAPSLVKKGLKHKVEFVPGAVCDSIPAYLIENPELKMAMLTIDLDDYEDTLTTLEFFYPRLVLGGILILDNYHKNLDEKSAVDRYFHPTRPKIKNFMVNKGPHYIVKP